MYPKMELSNIEATYSYAKNTGKDAKYHPPIELCQAPVFLVFLRMFFSPAWFFYTFFLFCNRT
jgi:hypothetical protein